MRENGSINPTSLTKWNVSLPKISIWPNACFCLYFIIHIVPKKMIFLMIIFLFYFEPQRNLKVALLAGIVADWCMIRLRITTKIQFLICNRSIFACHIRPKQELNIVILLKLPLISNVTYLHQLHCFYLYKDSYRVAVLDLYDA